MATPEEIAEWEARRKLLERESILEAQKAGQVELVRGLRRHMTEVLAVLNNMDSKKERNEFIKRELAKLYEDLGWVGMEEDD